MRRASIYILTAIGFALNCAAVGSLVTWQPMFGGEMSSMSSVSAILAFSLISFAFGNLVRSLGARRLGLLNMIVAAPVLVWFLLLFLLFGVLGASR